MRTLTMPDFVDGRNAADQLAQSIRDQGATERYRDWYVGITADLEERMGTHGLPAGHTYFHVETRSRAAAGEAERILLDEVGCDGGPGGGPLATFVYAFRKWPAFARKRAALQGPVAKRRGTDPRSLSPHRNVTGGNGDLFRIR